MLSPCLSSPSPSLDGRGHPGATAASSFSVKDLDSIFLLLVGDIFGSQAARAAKYGQGWNLLGLTRSRQWRDYNAALSFLVSR